MENQNVIVIANNAKEMQVAQNSLISYFQNKIDSLTDQIRESDQNIKIARKRKWRVAPFHGLKERLQKDFEFYEKIKAALEAGFVIIPNLNEIDVFAIRTTRKNPKRNIAHGGENWVDKPIAQESSRPSVGQGRYVNADTINKKWTFRKILSDGSTRPTMASQAVAFDKVDFPFKFVKPEIMERTSEAMQKLIFDDIGILPNRNIRRGDPMIVGRISKKQGYMKKHISFLITWFVDTSAI